MGRRISFGGIESGAAAPSSLIFRTTANVTATIGGTPAAALIVSGWNRMEICRGPSQPTGSTMACTASTCRVGSISLRLSDLPQHRFLDSNFHQYRIVHEFFSLRDRQPQSHERSLRGRQVIRKRNRLFWPFGLALGQYKFFAAEAGT
jgi:hypothetical protein